MIIIQVIYWLTVLVSLYCCSWIIFVDFKEHGWRRMLRPYEFLCAIGMLTLFFIPLLNIFMAVVAAKVYKEHINAN